MYMEQQKMNKNTALKIFLFLLGLLVLFFIFNRFDAPEPPGVFTHGDLVPASFEKNNGFYFIVALGESPGCDVLSEKTTTKYRKLFDPAFDNDRFMKEWDSQEYRKRFLRYKRIIRFVNQYRDDWVSHVRSQKDKIQKVAGQVAFLLDRYQKLVNSDMVRDFTSIGFPVDNDALLMVAMFYTSLRIIDFQAGNPGGIRGILAQIHLSKKLLQSSRSLYLAYTAQRILQQSLMALTSVMNQNQCSPGMISLIFKELTPLTYEEYGIRNAFIGHYLAIEGWIDSLEGYVERGNTVLGKELGYMARAFFQKQRTRNYYFQFISTCIKYEKKPPFRWESPLPEPGNLQQGFFWWLQNSTGKFLYSKLYNPEFKHDILMSHYTKAIYDMTRICAEPHLNYTGKKPVNDLLKRLKAFQTPDPFSGNSYKWNETKQLLYSVGQDRSDDGGVFKRSKGKGSDIVIPLRPHGGGA